MNEQKALVLTWAQVRRGCRCGAAPGCCHTPSVLMVSVEERISTEWVAAATDGSRPGSVGGSVGSRRRRRQVSVGCVRGVLTLGERGWVVANDAEVRLLEALRAESGARDRLWAIVAALDAGVVEAAGLRRLNGRLSAILAVERPEELWQVQVPGDLLGAVAYVCVCMHEEMLSRWLEFALAARLDPNLVRGLLPGPGWESWSLSHRRRRRSYDRETHWISEASASFWDRLQAHRDGRLRAVAAASDPVARPKMLKSLADEHREVPEVLDLLASNPRTPTQVLRQLVKYHGAAKIGLRVAQNRCVAVGLLGELAKSRDWELRYVAAWHPKMPVSALSRLARDEVPEVRAAVARAVSAPTAVLEVLASDVDVWVRRNVAWNPSTPQPALEVLLGDRLADVRTAAVANKDTAVQLAMGRARDRTVRVRRAVARRREVDVEVLTTLASDPEEAVRREVALNAATPSEVLDVLAGDSCLGVRAGVAYNRAASPDTLKLLAEDEDWWIQASLGRNKSTPVEILEVLAADSYFYLRGAVARNPAAPAELLRTLAADRVWYVRADVASNTAVPNALLEVLAEDSHPWVRRGLCDNDKVPLGLVDALRADPDYWVRAEAAAVWERRGAQTAPDTVPQAEITRPDQIEDEGETRQ